MSSSYCPHYVCSNRNSFGYCKTTVCINEHYQQEQWGFPSTTNKSESVVIKPRTNADRIRSMSDEEMAEFLFHAWNNASWCSPEPCPEEQSCLPCWLDWLKQEVKEGK